MSDTSNYSVITLVRRKALARITSGVEVGIAPITHIAFGDNGIDSSGNVIMPTENQLALNHEVERYAIDAYIFLEETTVRYTVTIPKAEMVGVSISEMALVDSNGDLCAIKNMSAKGKDSDVVFTFEFDDVF